MEPLTSSGPSGNNISTEEKKLALTLPNSLKLVRKQNKTRTCWQCFENGWIFLGGEGDLRGPQQECGWTGLTANAA